MNKNSTTDVWEVSIMLFQLFNQAKNKKKNMKGKKKCNKVKQNVWFTITGFAM